MHSVSLQFRPAPRDLRPWVLGFAERWDTRPFFAALELPDPNPCLYFMLRGRSRVGDHPVPRAVLWGPTVASTASMTDAPAHAFIVVLTALGATRLARSDLRDLIGGWVEVDALGSRELVDLSHQIGCAAGLDDRVGIACRRLRAMFTGRTVVPTKALVMADMILRHQARGAVATLAAQANVTPRGLHKAFIREVGCGPKRLLRVARLQRVLRTLHPQPWSPQAAEDAVLEYVDQAHLDRDFLDLTGLSRSSYVSSKQTLQDHLVHTVAFEPAGVNGAGNGPDPR